MEPSILLRVVVFFTGIFMMILTVSSLARRKMNESFCLAWGIISIAIIIAGVVLRPSELQNYISITGLVLVFIVFFVTIYLAYFVSLKISDLSRKNQELAIQVSLLNQENERILERIGQIAGIDIRDI